MNVAIIQYGAGNSRSVAFALERLGATVNITSDRELIRKADKVIFPGVGEAAAAMRSLRETGLDALLPELKQPVLGICLGMQLLCRHTEEGDTTGFGIFDTNVQRFQSEKVPHMGWNNLEVSENILFRNLAPAEYVYFVHSYYAAECNDTIASTEYGCRFSSALQRNNFYGLQFHPEKSAEAGARIIENFLAL